MWRIRYPDGWLSDMVNLTRAKDAAGLIALSLLNADRRAVVIIEAFALSLHKTLFGEEAADDRG